ncbi:hypothetical protein FNV43_RR16933 [Rhamnella rubrinervis]|uniref:Elongation factor Ts, mitochondrial n=1 Tax=Rhamnella rubrinervis TaxID=2594499 RepID=A0A8K0GZU8_9ROSA|nr:hypothetical protein FNV43_RR16933 [Rhamnella rubrinervis]
MEDQKVTFGLRTGGVIETVDVLVTQSEERAQTWLHKALQGQDAAMLYIGIDCHFTTDNVPATVEIAIGTSCLIFQLWGSKLLAPSWIFFKNSAKTFLTTKRLKGKLMTALRDDLGVRTFDCIQARKFLEYKEGSMRLPNWRDEAAKILRMDPVPPPDSVKTKTGALTVLLSLRGSAYPIRSGSNREEGEAHRRLHIYDYDTSKAKARISGTGDEELLVVLNYCNLSQDACTSATGTDVAVEEPDSPVADEDSSGVSEVSSNAADSGKSSTISDASPTSAQPKRSRPVKKSEMPPITNEELVPGATFTGKVRWIQPFGAFVDFGAFTDGLDLEGTVKNKIRAGAFISLPEGEEGFLPISEEVDEGFGIMMGSPLWRRVKKAVSECCVSQEDREKEVAQKPVTPKVSEELEANGQSKNLSETSEKQDQLVSSDEAIVDVSSAVDGADSIEDPKTTISSSAHSTAGEVQTIEKTEVSSEVLDTEETLSTTDSVVQEAPSPPTAEHPSAPQAGDEEVGPNPDEQPEYNSSKEDEVRSDGGSDLSQELVDEQALSPESPIVEAVKGLDDNIKEEVQEQTPAESEILSASKAEDDTVGAAPEKNDSVTNSNGQTAMHFDVSNKNIKGEATISPALVKQLREETGAGMMDCKNALSKTGGDIVKAREFLRKKGLASPEKKASRATAEGRIGSYIHDSRIGVLVEVNCETDFVSRGDIFKELKMFPEDIVNKEKEIEMQKEDLLSKPEQIRSKIVEGQIKKRLDELALLEQPYIKNDKLKTFVRYNRGEGLEKKSRDFAAEVAAQTAAKSVQPVPKEQASVVEEVKETVENGEKNKRVIEEMADGGERKKIVLEQDQVKTQMEDQTVTFELQIGDVMEMVDVLVTQSAETAQTWLHTVLHGQDLSELYIRIDCYFTTKNAPATTEMAIGKSCLIFQIRSSKLPRCLLDFLDNNPAKVFLTTRRLKEKLMSALRDDLGAHTFKCIQARREIPRVGYEYDSLLLKNLSSGRALNLGNSMDLYEMHYHKLQWRKPIPFNIPCNMLSIAYTMSDTTKEKKHKKTQQDDDAYSSLKLEDLPDEIIVHILSLLPLKDAAATSILSSRWRYFWRFTTSMSLNFYFDLTDNHGSYRVAYDAVRYYTYKKTQSFIDWVETVVDQHLGGIKSLRVCFLLFRKHKIHVDKWIKFAMRSKSLERSVSVSGNDVEYFLSNAPLLERLAVRDSPNLTRLRVCGQSLALKYLEIRRCPKLSSVEICDLNIVSLSFDGLGNDIKASNFILKNVPLLVELFVDFPCCSSDFEILFSCCLSQIQVLRMNDFYRIEKHYYRRYPVLPNVKQLHLRLYGNEYKVDGGLGNLHFMIDAFPNLEKLALHTPFHLPPAFEDLKLRYKKAPNCPHYRLKEVEVLEYSSKYGDIDRVLYLIKNTVGLQRIVINCKYDHTLRIMKTKQQLLEDEEVSRRQALTQLQPQVPSNIQFVCL